MLNPSPVCGETDLFLHWSGRWQKVREDILATCPGFFDDPAYWDGTRSRIRDEDLQKIPPDIADYILELGLVNGKSRVLDIGCGVGNYSIPFAKVAGSVTTLDPSQKLLDLLIQRAAGERLKNIIPLLSFWNREVSLPMEKHYDFVLASFCPGVTDADGLIQMHNASSRYCGIIGYNNTTDQEFDRLWRLITGRGTDPNIFEIIFPFNLLYGLGIPANLKVFTWHNTPSVPSEKACASFESLFGRMTHLDDRKRRAIVIMWKRTAGMEFFAGRRPFTLGSYGGKAGWLLILLSKARPQVCRDEVLDSKVFHSTFSGFSWLFSPVSLGRRV